jgi:regulatory protein
MNARRIPRKLTDENALYDYAIAALGRRMRSVAELKRLLRQRVAENSGEAMVERVIARLKQHKYLNDTAYACAYSSFRRDNEKLGKRRVISDLKARGVHSEVIEQAVGAAYSDINEEELARDFLRRKRVSAPSDQRGAARVFRMMARAGFASPVIIRILKNWDVDDEMLSQLEGEQE